MAFDLGETIRVRTGRFPTRAAALGGMLALAVVLAIRSPLFETTSDATHAGTPEAGGRSAVGSPLAGTRLELDPASDDTPMETLLGEAARPYYRILKVGKGDTLMSLLVNSGIGKAEAHEAVAALREVYNPRELRPGQEITVTFNGPIGAGTEGFKGISLKGGIDRDIEVVRTEDGGFTANEIKKELELEVTRARAAIETSLYDAAVKNAVPLPVLFELVKAFSFDVDFQRDLQEGDTFEVMFEHFLDEDGHVVSSGNLLYGSLTLSGRTTRIYRFGQGDDADYYNERGESIRKSLLRTPIDGARLTSGFGMRKHPILGYSRMHRGVDFGAATGTPIMAAGSGVVEYAGRKGAYGNYLRIRHGNGYLTAYAHLSRFASGIAAGRRVKQGEIVGYVGSTGSSTGPHLHYEILAKGTQINPLKAKQLPTGRKLQGKELKTFLAEAKRLDTQFADLGKPRDKVAQNTSAEDVKRR